MNLHFIAIPELSHQGAGTDEPLWRNARLICRFACATSVAKTHKVKGEYHPSSAQFLNHPLAAVAYIPKDVAVFLAGAVSGATAKTVTAPLNRIKLLMQTHGVRAGTEGAKKAVGFIEAIIMIGKEEGIKGYWKGILPQN